MATTNFVMLEKGPFKNETQEERLFFETIGRMSAYFSPLEAFLDISCMFAFNHLGGDRHEKAIPRSFSKKLGFLRKLVPKIALDEIDRATARKLLDDFEEASGRRNEILHAMVLSVERDLVANALLVARGERSHSFPTRSFSIPDIEDFTRHLYHLTEMADRLLMIVITAVGHAQGVSVPQQLLDSLVQTPPSPKGSG
jgi:hypothetical protein